MKKLKILLHGDYFLQHSGYARILKDIIPNFIKKGHEVRQVALKYDGLTTKNEIFCYPTTGVGAGGHFAPEVLRRAILDFEPDIVFSLGDYFSLPPIVPVISKPYKKPFKFVFYGFSDGEPLDRDSTYASTWVHHHIFPSNFGKKTLEKSLQVYFNNYKKVDGEIVYPAVDTKVFHKLDDLEGLRNKYKLEGKFVVLFLSRNQYRKNLPVLMEAVSKLKKIIPHILLLIHSIPTVDITGRPEGYDLPSIVKYLDIEDKIATVTTKNNALVPQDIINKLYNLADITCVPTMGEGFGLFLTESMATGTPNISTDCSSVSELLTDGRGILIKPSANIFNGGITKHSVVSADDVAHAIFTIYNDKKLRESCIKNGEEFIKELTPEKVSDKLLDIFNKVIKEDKQPIALETKNI
jgi:glycosyltransferase involved in cell wall biosynthesis